MRKRTSLIIFSLLLALAVMGAKAYAADQGQGAAAEDDDLGIGEQMKDEAVKNKKKKKEERIVKKEDLPPIKMVFIKGGCFNMGDFTGDGDDDERPAHEVCIDDYYMAETEVTQELFEALIGSLPATRINPDMKKDPQAPVNYVTWTGVSAFIKKLNEVTGGFYRLPSEAEWEFAARERGKDMRWSGTDNEAELRDYAVFSDNSVMMEPVKSKQPNALGLYGLTGNVFEWVEDYFDFDYYKISPLENPPGADHSMFRVVRGGSFLDQPSKLRTTYRYGLEPGKSLPTLGFRLVE